MHAPARLQVAYRGGWVGETAALGCGRMGGGLENDDLSSHDDGVEGNRCRAQSDSP